MDSESKERARDYLAADIFLAVVQMLEIGARKRSGA